MKKNEALRLALEALENLGNHDHICPQWPTYAEPENYPKCNCGYDQAITAIKAALEAKDEPVAWMCADESLINKGYARFSHVCMGEWKIPVYTTPPQRTWVGLTDEEMHECAGEYPWTPTGLKCVRAIEAKLKQKNEQQTQ
jgi:hypothetical protein